MTHDIKILPQYFKLVEADLKKFELRRHDRDYKVGDYLRLSEWINGKYTGRKVTKLITHILTECTQFGLMDGYCILSID